MNKTTEALKLAEEALETDVQWGFVNKTVLTRRLTALAAIREALDAQKEKPAECANGCPKNTVCDYCQRAEPVKQDPVAHYKDAPHTIYLQTGCEDPEFCECSFNEWGDTTWCKDQIHDTDIPYIRADYAAPVQPVKQEPVGLVESSEEWGVAGVLIAGLPIGTKLYAAPVSCATSCPDAKANAKERYDRIMAECEEPDPIERLRFFCSLAMTGKNWIDVEEFFDDLIAERKAIRAEALDKAALIVDHILKEGGGTYGDVIRGLK